MKTKQLTPIVLFLLLSIFFSGCGPGQVLGPTMTPTFTVTPTYTKTPTFTPTNTSTPIPTNTSTPLPTSTATPTITPTAVGSGLGKITFVQMLEGSGEGETIDNIFVMNIDGTDLKQITHSKGIELSYFRPRWSPDGKKILFTRTRKGVEYYNSSLYTMNPDGSNVEKISPVPQYRGNINVEEVLWDVYGDWSPDGKSIIFCSNRHVIKPGGNFETEIFILDLTSFAVTQISNGYGSSEHPSWSPDGKKIAFMSNRDGDWEIYLMNSDGTGLQQLTKNRASDRFPRWSPDGRKIIFHSDRDDNIELYMIDIENLEESRITTHPATDATASFSPDGQWIIFHSDRGGDTEIYIMTLDGSELIQLTDNEVEDAVADWAP